ncbi:oligosaccharyltransferase complex subunit gamma [Paragonimus westermani]|uniref:Oligosaccharyltransferase complex subunit gamma n=1 Tax=Paragonimus westermani TaxID=34504 RepID=A0A5J4P1U7_9TREM|nr:oligosaccharyltransferase complex subunit gamma [Paragonimus westermani]KAA3681659.1 oligosaccharyltransferase complex subunit gamma [Paragonimus westermani]
MYVVLSAFLCILGYCYGFQEYSLDVRFRRLSELSLYNSVPKFTSDEFRTFALSKPRNYSLFVFLTALSKHHFTDQLKLAEQEFRILADSWKRRSGELFFALADHDRDPEIFQILNLTTVPAILYVNPKGVIKFSDFMNIQRYGLSADAVADWIEGLTSIRIRVVRPPSYMGTFLLALFMTIGGAALWFRRVSLSPLLNPSLWCMLSLVSVHFKAVFYFGSVVCTACSVVTSTREPSGLNC